jgi:hypothetical protein
MAMVLDGLLCAHVWSLGAERDKKYLISQSEL